MRSETAPTRARKRAACADGKGNANGVTSSTSPGALPALARIDPRLLRAAAVGGLLGGLGMFFPGAGSVITAVATDAPLLPHQCQALARRVTLGLARTGTTGSHFSGDLFLAFSTANPGAFTPGFATLYRGAVGGSGQLSFIPWGFLDPFCEAVVQGVEEAVANALVANEEMVGRGGHRTPALPRDRVTELAGTGRAEHQA